MKELLHLGQRGGAAWRLPLRRGDQRTRPHQHDELELVLVRSGAVAYEVDGAVRRLGPGEAAWVFPAQVHALVAADDDLSMWVVVAGPELLAQLCTTPASAPLRGSAPPPDLSSTATLDPGVRRWADERLQELDGVDDAAAFNAALGFVLLALWTSTAPRREDGPSDVVAEALTLLRTQADGGSVAALARRVGVSASHLSRLVRRETGTTIGEHRQAARIARFLDLYDRGQRMSITDAAYAAGFGSYAQFHRVFRAAVGCTPADYRRRRSGASPAPHAGLSR